MVTMTASRSHRCRLHCTNAAATYTLISPSPSLVDRPSTATRFLVNAVHSNPDNIHSSSTPPYSVRHLLRLSLDHLGTASSPPCPVPVLANALRTLIITFAIVPT